MAISIRTGSPEHTMDVGHKLCGVIKNKPLPYIVLLYGDLGSGKTTLIKGIARCLGIDPKDIGSASFVILVQHNSTPPLYHIDLYRLDNEEDLEFIGIWDYLDDEAIIVIEWAEHIKITDKKTLKVIINDIDENTRDILIEGLSEEDWDIL
ncbi:MAG: tRNA (adenosine(37)-N6)-threonylcarbamoyltransferase complex ATPase subunit type 1 TsaE [Thermodesulfovibrionales bacterium]